MSRAEWILGVILIVLLLAVGLLSLLLWFRPEGGTSVAGPGGVAEATSVQTGQTATTAALLAEETARAWQADAQLLKVTATWPQGSELTGLARGQETWNLTFYSPGETAVAEIVVLDDGATLLSERKVDAPLAPMMLSGWNIDSSEAVRLFLDNGGTNFGRNQANTTLIMNLNTETESGRIEWFISLFANDSGNSLTMRIDATSGEILQQIAGP